MSTFKTNPWDIDQLLSFMDSSKIVLPEFQRNFVWAPRDIDQLLTSLVQDFPAGSLLFLRANGTGGLAWRAAEGVEPSPHATPDYLVLDGQQRLTSLSLALNGRGDHVFLMDLQLIDDDDLDNGIYFLRRKDAEKRGLFDRETQFARHTYPLWVAIGEHADDWWFQDYAQFHADNGGGDLNELRERAKRLQAEFVRPLKDYRFPVVELPSDTSLEAVCQIFETLNKTGMKLTVFDLLTAKFWPHGVNLRELLEQAQEEYPLLGREEFNVDATLLIQAISLLRSGLCKRGDLLKLTHENFENDWWQICRAASAALTMLKGECGVLTRSWLPYGALFPSLFAITTKILELSGPEAGAGWEKLRRWFWCSCFSQRYDGPPNTLNAADLRQMSHWMRDDERVPDAITEFSLDSIELRRAERNSNAVYRAVICLTIVNGARDFHTGNRLTADALKDPSRRIEDHHLFPTGWLRKQTPPRSAENSILNRALIDYQTNRRISDKTPSAYLAEIEAALGDEKLQELLASHLIPYEGSGALVGNDPDAFLTARERLLLGAIAGVTGATLRDTSAGETYLDPNRPFTNELALRRVIRELRGRVFWYEQHMTPKALELLAEELDTSNVTEVLLLSGPANISDRAKSRFHRFSTELAHLGVQSEWRVLPADVARDMHARVLFDEQSTWELPPLNSLLKGTVDSIRPSAIPRSTFEQAWARDDAQPLIDVAPTTATSQRTAQAEAPTPTSTPGDANGSATPASRPKWNEQSFFAELEARRGPHETHVARELYTWFQKNMTRIGWGSGEVDGSMQPALEHNGETYWPALVFTTGRVEIEFYYLTKPPFDRRETKLELLRRLNEIPGVSLPPDAIAKRPSIRLELLEDHHALKKLVDALTWLRDEVHSVDAEQQPEVIQT